MKRFLLISDLHASDVDPSSSGAPSYVSSFVSVKARVDPLTELERLIAEESLSPDCILCPGDITNRAEPIPFSYAWDKLQKLSQRFGVPLVATVGNHDVDSRYKSSAYDATAFAKGLVPTIPTNDRQKFLEFWAENFTIVSMDDCNVLVLNTAAYHGSGRDADAEIGHGRISDYTLNAIEGVLQKVPKASVNLLLCHHHVLKSEQFDDEFGGLTRGGDRLVQILNESAQAWIVVHGHKHVPDIFYGHGGSNSPVILACASFSAQVNVDAQNKNPNQFHILTCDPEGARSSGWSSAGSIESWTWQPGIGWKRARGPHGFGHKVGFGYRASVATLANEVASFLTSKNASQASWSEAVAAIPSLQRLVPDDFSAFERVLQEKGLAILTDRDGSLAQVGKIP